MNTRLIICYDGDPVESHRKLIREIARLNLEWLEHVIDKLRATLKGDLEEINKRGFSMFTTRETVEEAASFLKKRLLQWQRTTDLLKQCRPKGSWIMGVRQP